MYHYVYEIRNLIGEFYIGCRSSRTPPEQDSGYVGSGVWSLYVIASSQRTKRILSCHTNRYSAEVEESRLIRENIDLQACMNRTKSIPRRSPRQMRQMYVQQALQQNSRLVNLDGAGPRATGVDDVHRPDG